MTCISCGKSDRARPYCRRPGCGVPLAAAIDHRERYNASLAALRSFSPHARYLAESAYALASEGGASPGPRAQMLKIADLASELAAVIDAARELP